MELPERNEVTKVIPVRDLAKLAGIPYRTLYRWLETGTVPGKSDASKAWRLDAFNSALVKAKSMRRRARAA